MQHAGDILVVDDHAPTVEFIAEALGDEGYSVRTARDSAQAQRLLAEWRPDLVLMDMHMPGKPGDLLVHELRSSGIGDLPIILMTADTRLADVLARQGMPFCLIKPFNLDDLLDCVAAHVRHIGGAGIAKEC